MAQLALSACQLNRKKKKRKKKGFLLIYFYFDVHLAPMGIVDRIISGRMKRTVLRSIYPTAIMVDLRGDD